MTEDIKETDIAQVESCDIGFDGRGNFMIFTRFVYRKGGQLSGPQKVEYFIDEEFIKRFIKACGVDTLCQCNGIMVLVEHTGKTINRIIPLSKEADKYTFDIDKWKERQ